MGLSSCECPSAALTCLTRMQLFLGKAETINSPKIPMIDPCFPFQRKTRSLPFRVLVETVTGAGTQGWCLQSGLPPLAARAGPAMSNPRVTLL